MLKKHKNNLSKNLEEKDNQEEPKYKLFGGKEWYLFSQKYCCNFQFKKNNNKCITLYSPYFLFESLCNECEIGINLAKKYESELLTIKGEN